MEIKAKTMSTSSDHAALAPEKRVRKRRSRTCTDDVQRERKREMDRKAQRLSREKTKSHIAHLEKLVEIMYEKNDSAVNIDLLEEVDRLNAEIERLRKIIWNIRNLVGGGALGDIDVAMAGEKNSPSEDRDEEPDEKEKPPEQQHSLGHDSNLEIYDGSMDMDDVLESSNGYEASPNSSNDFCGNIAIQDRVDTLDAMTFDSSGFDELIIPAHAQSTPWDEKLCSNYVQAQVSTISGNSTSPLWTFLNAPVAPITFTPRIFPESKTVSKLSSHCHLWQRANKIYSPIFKVPRSQTQNKAALNFDPGLLFQVVKDGWDTLSGAERRNPILQILKEVDSQLFRSLDLTSRLAIVWKSHTLLKYLMISDADNLEQLPAWVKPLPAQKSHQYPPAVSFFPWPALRARLLDPASQTRYFSTPDFSIAYTRHFKLCWPFAFEDTFTYNPSTSKYEMSPLFERYFSDLRYWGMERAFFERFPELRGDMAGYDGRIGGEVGKAFGNVDVTPGNGHLGGGLRDSGLGRDEETNFIDVSGMGILEGLPCA